MSAPQYSLWVKDLQPDDLQRFALDLVQPKYDGWYATLVIKNGVGKFWSRGGKLLKEIETTAPDAVIIGEFLINTEWAKAHPEHGWFIAFDMDVWQANYLTRVTVLDSYLEKNQIAKVRLIETKFLSCQHSQELYRDKDTIWREWVTEKGFEGLIFRRSTDMGWYAYRLKKKQTWDFYVVRNFMKGKRQMLGLAETEGGKELFTCWHRGKDFAVGVGFCCEVRGQSRLKSGAVRSPVFMRWRPDKQPAA